jgi:hypothetical protein
MSLNYGTLKTQILEDAHRPDLSTKVDDFIRQAEGEIYSRLRASEMIVRVNLTDADRVTADEGFYTLPTDYLEERSLFIEGTNGCMLESVSLAELRRVAGSAPVRHYSVISDSEVEFRGVPSTTDEIELIYFARPAAFSGDSDVNDVLTKHESIYLYAALSALYLYTQDLELAQAAAASAAQAIVTVNEQAGRAFGGARTAGYYDLNSWGAR